MRKIINIQGKELLKVEVQGQTRNLLVLRGDKTTLPFHAQPLVEAFNAERGTNLRLLSHQSADLALNHKETWSGLPDGFVVDMSIAYAGRDVVLGDTIIHSPVQGPKIISATGDFKGEKNVALAAQGLTSADVAFTIDGRQRAARELLQDMGIKDFLALDLGRVTEIIQTVVDGRLVMIPDFPCVAGWYEPHPATGVPHGAMLNLRMDPATGPDARIPNPSMAQAPNAGEQTPKKEEAKAHLVKRSLNALRNSAFSGMLVRYGGVFGLNRWYVNAACGPDTMLGVVAEVPDSDIAKITALIRKAAKGGAS